MMFDINKILGSAPDNKKDINIKKGDVFIYDRLLPLRSVDGKSKLVNGDYVAVKNIKNNKYYMNNGGDVYVVDKEFIKANMVRV